MRTNYVRLLDEETMPLVPYRVNLAIAAVVIIASKAGTPISQKELAAYLSVSDRYLEAPLQALARMGLLKSARGQNGGYSLAGEPEQITCAAIIKALLYTDTTQSTVTSHIDTVAELAVAECEHDLLAHLEMTTVADLYNRAKQLDI